MTWLASECLSCLNLYLCSDTVGEMVIFPSVHCTQFHSSPGVHCCALFVCCSTTARFWEKILAAPHRAALRAWNLAQCGQMCNNIYTGKPDWLQNLWLFMTLWVGHSWSLPQLCWSLLCRLPCLLIVCVSGGLCRLCIFQGVGEEPTLSNEAIHNMDGYDKCILVSGHFQKRKAYRTHYGLLKGRFSSLAHSAMGCSMRWYNRFCRSRGSNGAVGCCRCALLHIETAPPWQSGWKVYCMLRLA